MEGGATDATGGDSAASEPEPHAEPDMTTAVSDIMGHSERVEEHHAMGKQKLQDGEATRSGLVYVKANEQLKAQSLPLLDNLVSRKTGNYFGIIWALVERLILCHFLVYSDSVAPLEVIVSRRHYLHCGARLGNWRCVRDAAFIV